MTDAGRDALLLRLVSILWNVIRADSTLWNEMAPEDIEMLRRFQNPPEISYKNLE